MPQQQQNDPYAKYQTPLPGADPYAKYAAAAPSLPSYPSGQQAKVGDFQRAPGSPIENKATSPVQQPPHAAGKGRALEQMPGGGFMFVDAPQGEEGKMEAANAQGAQTGGNIGLAAATLPLAVANPIAAVGSMAGGYGGGKLARMGARKLGADEDIQDFAEAGGNLGGGIAGGYAGSKLQNMIPSTTRAGANFQKVSGTVGDKPVPLNDKLIKSMADVHDLVEAGGQKPGVVYKFIKRVGDINRDPITYDEARRFYSNASRLSSNEYQNMNPQMLRAVGQFTNELGNTIKQVPEEAGMGQTYADAMKEYRQAQQLKLTGKTLAKVGAGAVGAGTGGYLLKKLILDRAK